MNQGIGQPVRRKEDARLLVGAGTFSDDVQPIPPDPSVVAPERAVPDVVLINRDGPIKPTPYYPLAVDKVRFVGEGVVLVVAETLSIARDAAELVEIDYEVLPAVVDTAKAAEPGAPLVWEHARSNVLLDAEIGDAAAAERAFAAATHVVRLETWVQ